MYSRLRQEAYITDSVAVAHAIHDSLQKIYTTTISTLDTKLNATQTNADSLKTQLDTRLSEIYKLKNQVSNILKNKSATKEDMSAARKMVSELQEKVNSLQGENLNIAEEKKRLTTVLEQLTTDMQGLQQNVKRLGEENKTLTEKVGLASLFVASELKLTSVMLKNAKEQETLVAKKTNKFIISFTVQNNINDYSNAEVIVVVTQPDGHVLQNGVWESGTFTLSNGLKKDYTSKMRFEYPKGESRHLISSINADSYQKGNYTLQVFHNGYLIGQVSKILY
jgi:predicted RNase H-like nuclease (RuvC/YqgF family)